MSSTLTTLIIILAPKKKSEKNEKGNKKGKDNNDNSSVTLEETTKYGKCDKDEFVKEKAINVKHIYNSITLNAKIQVPKVNISTKQERPRAALAQQNL